MRSRRGTESVTSGLHPRARLREALHKRGAGNARRRLKGPRSQRPSTGPPPARLLPARPTRSHGDSPPPLASGSEDRPLGNKAAPSPRSPPVRFFPDPRGRKVPASGPTRPSADLSPQGGPQTQTAGFRPSLPARWAAEAWVRVSASSLTLVGSWTSCHHFLCKALAKMNSTRLRWSSFNSSSWGQAGLTFLLALGAVI